MLHRVFRSVRALFTQTFCPHGIYAVFDPSGNWSVDLQAGSEYGYKLLFVILLGGFFAVILQVVSSLDSPVPGD
jgi:metal iron transporter